jgi:predicted nucleotidyltransferase
MTRDEVIERLRSTESDLRALGIDKLYLFGSFARDEADDDSDVDVFVEFSAQPGNRFRGFMNSIDVLSEAVGRQVDLGTRGNFHRLVRDEVEREAIRVF